MNRPENDLLKKCSYSCIFFVGCFFYKLKELPHPQLLEALGLLMTN